LYTGIFDYMRRIRSIFFYVVMGALLFAWGCFTVPVQEISDARLTLRTAYDAGASTYAAESLSEAELLLQRATQKMEEKAYGEARHFAILARERASAAREIALHRSQSQ
jgi:hypothetical protein